MANLYTYFEGSYNLPYCIPNNQYIKDLETNHFDYMDSLVIQPMMVKPMEPDVVRSFTDGELQKYFSNYLDEYNAFVNGGKVNEITIKVFLRKGLAYKKKGIITPTICKSRFDIIFKRVKRTATFDWRF